MRHRTKKTKPVYLLNVGAALAPVGNTTIVTAPTVTAPTVTAPAAAATAKKAPPKKKTRFGRSRFSRKSASDRSTLSGLVVFDEFGRPFEANTAALTESTSSSLSQRGFDVLGLVSQQKTVDFDDAISVGFGTTLTDHLSANVFAVTESALDTETAGLALTDPQAETGSEADFAAIGLSYRVAENWSVGGSYAVLRERGSVAGMVSDGAFSLGEEASTQFQGVNLTGKLDETWSLAVFYTRATIDSSGTQESLFDPADGWSGDHYGFMLDAKNALGENRLLRVSLTKPLQITSGTMSVRVPAGRELDGTVSYERRETSFDGSAMPLEAGVTYLAETGYGTIGFSLDLVDTNVNGAGESGVSVGAGFAFSFRGLRGLLPLARLRGIANGFFRRAEERLCLVDAFLMLAFGA